MTAASDNPSSGGDFDLSGFKSKPRKKADGESAAPRSPREYGESKPRSEAPTGPKKTGKLPSTFKSRERSDYDKPFRKPTGPRKPMEAGDAPRKKFASDFRPLATAYMVRFALARPNRPDLKGLMRGRVPASLPPLGAVEREFVE